MYAMHNTGRSVDADEEEECQAAERSNKRTFSLVEGHGSLQTRSSSSSFKKPRTHPLQGSDPPDLPDDFLEPLSPDVVVSFSPEVFPLTSTSNTGPAHACRQFWKAGEFPAMSADDDLYATEGMDHVRVHPRFLHSNATSHKWVLGAVAELLDNAVDEVIHGATMVNVDVIRNPINGDPMLLIEDNGGGMDPSCIRHCMSLGYSAKSKLANTIGQYGNGFKTSTMRLGADVVVFSRNTPKDGGNPTQSVGLLSYTFLTKTGQEDILVPIVDYEIEAFGLRKHLRGSVQQWNGSMETVKRWSPFSSEAALLDQFKGMSHQGTKVIIYNLWEDQQGLHELDFRANRHDIQVRGAFRDEKNISLAEKYPSCHHYLTYRHSLRSYISIMYFRLPSKFKMYLRGKEVEHHSLISDMMFIEEVTYKPQCKVEQTAKGSRQPKAVVTLGFVKDAREHVDVQGFSVYHKNRLIKPFWRVWNTSNIQGRGVFGVLEANFVEPAHDKQGFERTIVLSRLQTRLVEIQKNYWFRNCHKIGYVNNSAKRDDRFVLQEDHLQLGNQVLERSCDGLSKVQGVPSTVAVSQVQNVLLSPADSILQMQDVSLSIQQMEALEQKPVLSVLLQPKVAYSSKSAGEAVCSKNDGPSNLRKVQENVEVINLEDSDDLDRFARSDGTSATVTSLTSTVVSPPQQNALNTSSEALLVTPISVDVGVCERREVDPETSTPCSHSLSEVENMPFFGSHVACAESSSRIPDLDAFSESVVPQEGRSQYSPCNDRATDATSTIAVVEPQDMSPFTLTSRAMSLQSNLLESVVNNAPVSSQDQDLNIQMVVATACLSPTVESLPEVVAESNKKQEDALNQCLFIGHNLGLQENLPVDLHQLSSREVENQEETFNCCLHSTKQVARSFISQNLLCESPETSNFGAQEGNNQEAAHSSCLNPGQMEIQASTSSLPSRLSVPDSGELQARSSQEQLARTSHIGDSSGESGKVSSNSVLMEHESIAPCVLDVREDWEKDSKTSSSTTKTIADVCSQVLPFLKENNGYAFEDATNGSPVITHDEDALNNVKDALNSVVDESELDGTPPECVDYGKNEASPNHTPSDNMDMVAQQTAAPNINCQELKKFNKICMDTTQGTENNRHIELTTSGNMDKKYELTMPSTTKAMDLKQQDDNKVEMAVNDKVEIVVKLEKETSIISAIATPPESSLVCKADLALVHVAGHGVVSLQDNYPNPDMASGLLCAEQKVQGLKESIKAALEESGRMREELQRERQFHDSEMLKLERELHTALSRYEEVRQERGSGMHMLLNNC